MNQIQNANTKSVNGSISFKKLYAILNLDKDIKDKNRLKKYLVKVVDLMTTLRRIQINYTENNGTVLPGYLPSVGFAGSIKPSLGFTLGSQADIRYEAAKKGWLTDFSNFNQPITEVHNSKLSFNGQFSPFKSLIIDINAERSYSENINENYIIDKLLYYSQNSNLYGNYANSIRLN